MDSCHDFFGNVYPIPSMYDKLTFTEAYGKLVGINSHGGFVGYVLGCPPSQDACGK